MTIESTKTYRVEKFDSNGTDSDLGFLTGRDVRNMLKGYEYDADFGMWFSPKAKCGYSVTEA